MKNGTNYMNHTNELTRRTMTKEEFRRTKRWKDFRNKLKEKQKTDPITGQRLVKRFNLHHCDENPSNYENLIEEKFVCLNPQTHEIVHWFWGDANRRKNWREMIDKLANLLQRMDELNEQ